MQIHILQQSTFTEMELEKDILNSRKYELYLLGISSTSVMRIDLLRSGRLVERDESVQQIVACSVVVVSTVVIREVVAEGRVRELFGEQVNLIQKEND